MGEVGAGARAILEQPGLAHPQIHDAALVDEVVGDGLNEAGMRLGMLVGRLGLGQLAGLEVDIVVALARAIDAIGPVQAGIEPLRAVGRAHLFGQHEAHLVIEGACIFLAVEIAALPAPIGPCAGKTVEHVLGRALADDSLLLGQCRKRFLIRFRTPQPGGNAVLFHALQNRRDARLAEILLREDIGRDLAPRGRHLDVLLAEHHRPVRILDLADGLAELESRVAVLALLGEPAIDAHLLLPSSNCYSRTRDSTPARPLHLRSTTHTCPGIAVPGRSALLVKYPTWRSLLALVSTPQP